VVFGVGWVVGLAAIRLLGRAGIPVYALDHRRGSLGHHSRYADPLICPDHVADEAGFVAFLRRFGETLDAPVPILPCFDHQLAVLARNRDALADRFAMPFPSWDVLTRIQDKRVQLREAEAAGVPVPRWSDRPTDVLGYPVVVKPAKPAGFRERFGKQAFRCDDRRALDEAFAAAWSFDPIVQEYIPGGDGELYTFGGYLRPDGEALGVFTGRKLVQTPPGIGTCRVGEAVWVEPVAAQGLAFARALGHHGACQVEFKRDPRDGVHKLMEINPRLWQWHGLAAESGVNLPLISYRDALGLPVEPVTMDRRRRRWAITLKAGSRPVFVRPPYVDAVFARDDPRPAAVQLVRLGRGARASSLRVARAHLSRGAGTA
jgi:predicted ATP-grasp superfamily ATP-dependent carboligase